MNQEPKRRAFSGDATHKLSKPKMEPYRLWFEFLKLALLDDAVTVDESIYAEWGDVANEEFDKWWEPHWRYLFATPVPTTRLVDLGECRKALNDPDSIVVRVSLTGTSKQRIDQIKTAVGDALGARKPHTSTQARFQLTANRSMNLSNLRTMQNLYRFWLDAEQNLDAACRSYLKWADEWNQKVKERRWKRGTIPLPSSLRSYIDVLDGTDTSIAGRDALRKDLQRNIRRARKVAQNVGRGVFPGDYQD